MDCNTIGYDKSWVCNDIEETVGRYYSEYFISLVAKYKLSLALIQIPLYNFTVFVTC